MTLNLCIKRCPCCGSEASDYLLADKNAQISLVIKCLHCGVMLKEPLEFVPSIVDTTYAIDSIIRTWNRRECSEEEED